MTDNVTMGLTGFSAFCAMLIHDPIVSFVMMATILLTCFTYIIHTSIACWIANRKGAKRGRLRKKSAGAQ